MSKKELDIKIRRNGIFKLSPEEFNRWFFYNCSTPYYRCISYRTLKKRVRAIWFIKRRLWKNLVLSIRYVNYHGYSEYYLKNMDEEHFSEFSWNELKRKERIL